MLIQFYAETSRTTAGNENSSSGQRCQPIKYSVFKD